MHFRFEEVKTFMVVMSKCQTLQKYSYCEFKEQRQSSFKRIVFILSLSAFMDYNYYL